MEESWKNDKRDIWWYRYWYIGMLEVGEIMPTIIIEVVTIKNTLEQHIFINESEKCKEFIKNKSIKEYIYSIVEVPGEIYD